MDATSTAHAAQIHHDILDPLRAICVGVNHPGIHAKPAAPTDLEAMRPLYEPVSGTPWVAKRSRQTWSARIATMVRGASLKATVFAAARSLATAQNPNTPIDSLKQFWGLIK